MQAWLGVELPWPHSKGEYSLETDTFNLTDAIRQIEDNLARGGSLSDVVQEASRDFEIEASLLTRRWVQFTPSSDSDS